LCEFLAAKGFWVMYPRYRGAWESGGNFLERSPQEDVLDVIEELPKGFEEVALGRRFSAKPERVFVIGGSFGGAAAILAALDSRVNRVVANCPVTDWTILDRSETVETSNQNYAGYIRAAFANAYRLSDANWEKLRTRNFYSPWARRREIDGSKIMIVHAKDDPHAPFAGSVSFAEATGAKLKTVERGGHLRTEDMLRKHWTPIRKFLSRA
jgi:dipeptidyl aminopeptidase/acylaminoacyl peptidase